MTAPSGIGGGSVLVVEDDDLIRGRAGRATFGVLVALFPCASFVAVSDGGAPSGSPFSADLSVMGRAR